MPYNQQLADRIRHLLPKEKEISIQERKMFGGLCFMVNNHMAIGINQDYEIMARVGPDQYQDCLKQPHVREMDFTGTPLKGFVYVNQDGIKTDKQLQLWVNVCLDFIHTLPEKKRRIK